MRWRRVLLAVFAVVLAAVAGALIYARPLLMTGTGYAAHNACAVRFVAGRGPDAPAADLPDNPLVPFLRTSVSTENATATTSVLGVLFRQTAHYTRGSGCTLAPERPAQAATTVTSGRDLPTAAAAAGAAVATAVDAAFGEHERATALNTRAVVVVHRGTVIAERYGAGFTAQTPQLGWSMAKSVTGLMAGRLVQQGKIALDDDHLRPEWTDGRAAITVDQMLRMSTGLRWDETYDLGTPITRMLYLNRDMGGYAASLPAAHTPGSYQQYSSGTTNILCQVLQQRSGLGADLGTRLVFEPLGMSSAVWEADAAGHPVCSSYLWATPRDWAKIGQWALQGGQWNGEQLLPGDWMRYSTTAVAMAGEEDGYGAHWWVNRRPDGSLVYPAMPADTYWAAGHDGQRVIVVPSAGLVVVRMGFTPADVDLGVDRLVADLVTALRT
ncbi:MAG: serine hydrolase [Kineosporiaceae bacterium]